MIDEQLLKLTHDLMGHDIFLLQDKKNEPEQKLKVLKPSGPINVYHRNCCQSHPSYIGVMIEITKYDEEEDKEETYLFVAYSDTIAQLCDSLTFFGPIIVDAVYTSLSKGWSMYATSKPAGYYFVVLNDWQWSDIDVVGNFFPNRVGTIGRVFRQNGNGDWTPTWTKRSHMKSAIGQYKVKFTGDLTIATFIACTQYLPGDLTLNGANFDFEWFISQMNDAGGPPQPSLSSLGPSNYLNFNYDYVLSRIEEIRNLRMIHDEIQDMCQICKVQTPLFSDTEKGYARILKVVQE